MRTRRVTVAMTERSDRAVQLPELLLRLGVAGCFIGHGAFGVIGKTAWLPYFAVAGIGEDVAWRVMPIVGAIDVLVGILALVSPRPALLVYAASWAVWTALLRPLAGESVFETLERAGNYGVPLALLALAGATLDWRRWLEPLRVTRAAVARRRHEVMAVLRATTITLLVGHGGLALLGKPLLVEHVTTIGLPAGATFVMGAFDLALAALVAFRPVEPVFPLVVGWKLATEALYPLTGDPAWEFVERAGSYAAPLTLWIMMRHAAPMRVESRAPARLGVVAAITALIAAALPAVGVAGPPGVGSPALLRGAAARRIAVPTSVQDGPAVADAQRADSLLDRLRAGGFVLACRHAITGPTPRGREFDLADRSTQRLLSAEGEAQARRLGEILRRQRIPIGEVFTSPAFRTSDSAELTFGHADRSDALYGNEEHKRAERRRLFTSDPAPGTNRALMTHQAVLYRMMPDIERGSIREGDCVILDPDGSDFEIVERLGPDEWDALRLSGTRNTESQEPLASQRSNAPHGPHASQESRASQRSHTFQTSHGSQDSETAKAIAAARRGGTIIVCRHAITGSTSEVEPVDYDDPSTQRLLSAEGERQSEAMGRALQRLGIQVTKVIASPMQRARRTASLMFGRPPVIDSIWHTNGSDYGGPPRARRAHVLATPVPSGNHVIISHIGTMTSVIPEAEGNVDEGDCVVIQPAAETFDVVGIVPSRSWSSAGR